MGNIAAKNVQHLRHLMAQRELDAYIVPSADPHQTEYAHPHWGCRAWLSGFTGSAGTVAVLSEQAGLWTDGRYFIQAAAELEGSDIALFKMRMEGVPELVDWLCEQLPEGAAIGIDGRLMTVKQQETWSKKLSKANIRLVTDVDLIQEIWTDRPALPSAPALLYSDEFAGRSVADKLEEIREAMAKKEADSYALSSLYDIAWLFNVRGNDTPHCPLLTAYALIESEHATIFTDEAKLGQDLVEAWATAGVRVAPYADMFDAVAALAEETVLYACEQRLSTALRQLISCTVITGKDLTDLPKARKNECELRNWEQVHEQDGVAMLRFWRWLEAAVPRGVSEVDASNELERLRRACPDCVDLSFPAISAYGANAAMMHYRATNDACAQLASNGLYLLDSGGQYLGGTTDITRTFALGDLSDEQCIDYTLVLQGVINLSTARFLKGCAGVNLDILARQPLWEHGIDYKCGTGHGVGCYLNVHEGPQNFSPRIGSDTAFEPGMVVTIEPGVYKEDCYGIRIENMVTVEEDRETDSGCFYRFGTQTLCPIDTTPLKAEMLSPKEIAWLNAYHERVFARLAPLLEEEERAWLAEKTQTFG
jgi:Xaa-Pro aminopeptidase